MAQAELWKAGEELKRLGIKPEDVPPLPASTSSHSKSENEENVDNTK